MADYTDFNPANLRAGLLKSDRSGLKPSLTTSLYSGTGAPTHWNQLKPSLRHADGTLRAGLQKADGSLKSAALILGFVGGGEDYGVVESMTVTSGGAAVSATAGTYRLTDGTEFNTGSTSGSGLVVDVTCSTSTVTTIAVVDGGANYEATDSFSLTTGEAETLFGGSWLSALSFDVDSVTEEAGGGGGGGGGGATLTLSGMTNTAFNKDYAEVSQPFIADEDYFGISWKVEVTNPQDFKAYSYYTGSTYYLVYRNVLSNEWQVSTSSSDPETFSDNDTAIVQGNMEVLVATSELDGTEYRPDSTDSKVTYS